MIKYIVYFILSLFISNSCKLYATVHHQTSTTAQTQKTKIQSRKAYLPPQSALVIEYSASGYTTLYQQNADAIRHPASLTKIMTVYLLLEALQSNRVKPNTLFRVSKLASMQMPSKLNLKPGSYIRAIDCVKALLVKSANDVAVVVAEGLSGSVSEFCKQMNNKAKSLGMLSTHFENPSGVPNSKQVTSARDIFKLGVSLYKKFPQYWKYFSLKDFAYLNKHYATHCKILNLYKGSDGAKTGFINSSGFNLWVTAQRRRPNGTLKRLFVVVFGGPSGKLRDFRAAALMDKFFKDCTVDEPSVEKIRKTKTCTVKTETRKNTPGRDEREMANDVLIELDAVPIDDIVRKLGKSAEYFNELYKDDNAKILQITGTRAIDYSINRPNQLATKKHISSKKVKSIRQKPFSNRYIKIKSKDPKIVGQKIGKHQSKNNKEKITIKK